MSTASKRVRLSPDELFQLKWLLGGVLVLLGLGTLLTLDARSTPVLLAGALVTGLLVLWPRGSARLPEVFWKTMTPVLIIGVGLDFVLSRPDFVGPLLRMVAFLGILRAISPRRRREDLQLVLLCLFMVIISGVLTLSLAFAVQILLFTPAAMFLLFLVTLVEPRERAGEAPAPLALWKDFHWGPFLRRLVRSLDWKVLGLAGVLFSAVVVASSVIFIAMPRFSFEQALPFLNLQNRSAMAGFSENIQLGEVVDIIENDAVALRVDVPGGTTPGFLPYWRMLVLDEYTGSGFRLSPSAKVTRRFGTAVYPPSEAGRESDGAAWTFYLEPGISRYLPTVGDFRRLRFQNQQELEVQTTFGLISTARMGNSVLFFQYDGVEPQDRVRASRIDRPLPDAEPRWTRLPLVEERLTDRLRYPWTTLAVPDGDQNRRWLGQWLAEITGGEDLPPEVFAERASAWLAARKTYALQTAVPSGEGDLFLRWLNSNAPGHCELFAGSFVLLARAAGHPARVVTGFKGGTWNGFENYYMVRNRDAHAWVEMMDVTGTEWIRVDPTPGADAAARAAADDPLFGGLLLDRTLRAYLDSLRVLWYRRIVNFDQESQAELASQVKNWSTGFFQELRTEMQDRLTAMQAWLRGPWSWGKFGELIPWIAGFALAVWMLRASPGWWLAWRGRDRSRRPAEDPVRRRAGRWLVKLRRAPGPVPRTVIRDLQALRFGSARDWPDPRTTWTQARTAWKTAQRQEKTD